MEVFEYRRSSFIGISAIILLLALCFGFLPRIWFLVVIIGTAIPSSYLIYKGMKKVKIIVRLDSIMIFLGKQLQHPIHRSDIRSITFEITESFAGEGGFSVSRELTIHLANGEQIRLQVESMLKTRYLTIDALAAHLETWCDENGVMFTMEMKPLKKESDSKKKAIKLREYTSPPLGNFKDWKRDLIIRSFLSIGAFFIGIVFFIPSIGGVTSMTSRLAIIGLLVIILATCGLFNAIEKGLNYKPLKHDPTKMDGDQARGEPTLSGKKKPVKWLSTSIGKLCLFTVIFTITMLSPVFIVETRFTRGLFGIGLSQIFGTFILIFFLVAMLGGDGNNKKSRWKFFISKVSGKTVITLLVILAILLGFVGWFLG